MFTLKVMGVSSVTGDDDDDDAMVPMTDGLRRSVDASFG